MTATSLRGANSSSSSPTSTIVIDTYLSKRSSQGGQARLRLYLTDGMIADQPATKAGDARVKLEVTNKQTPVTVTFKPSDAIVRLTESMIEPEWYVAIDTDLSDLTYTEQGPGFGLKLGDRVDMVLQEKDKENNNNHLDISPTSSDSFGAVDGDGDGDAAASTTNTASSDASDAVAKRSPPVPPSTGRGNITVRSFLSRCSSRGGRAVLNLYLYDALVADRSAQLVDTAVVQLYSSGRPCIVRLSPDLWALEYMGSMRRPMFYVALDSQSSTLWYDDRATSSSAYGLQLGDAINVVLSSR